MRILVVNAGSSSLKLSVIGPADETLAACELAAPRARLDPDAIERVLDGPMGDVDAVGHRIVHGGPDRRGPVVVDGAVRAELEGLVDLAPLHQPKSLAALDAVGVRLTGIPVVACFDTAFHATLAPEASTYALPAPWRERWGIRRYGFHGLSHAWVARRVPELLGLAGPGPRLISCHLGAGASLCAIAGGRSVDTTMGFTPLEGLVMATRSGSVDPGLLLWLLEHTGLTETELAHALEHESGLLGLAGSADMAEVLTRARAGDVTARLAVGVFAHRLRASIAAMAASLEGVDVVAFTGGIGERSAEVRALAVRGLGFLGLSLSAQANADGPADREVSGPGARVRTAVVRAREDLEIARQVRATLT